MESRYLHKSVTFKKESEEDLELWEWLRGIGHGEFNKKTKEYWINEMRNSSGVKVRPHD